MCHNLRMFPANVSHSKGVIMWCKNSWILDQIIPKLINRILSFWDSFSERGVKTGRSCLLNPRSSRRQRINESSFKLRTKKGIWRKLKRPKLQGTNVWCSICQWQLSNASFYLIFLYKGSMNCWKWVHLYLQKANGGTS